MTDTTVLEDETIIEVDSSTINPIRAPFTRFSTEETIILCRAFVNVSEDPITGTDQKVCHFWTKVFNKFKELCARDGMCGAGNLKTVASLCSKFKKSILPDVNHYVGLQKQIPMASGENEDDYKLRLESIFETRFKKKFTHGGCMDVLKQMPRFEMMLKDDDLDIDSTLVNSGVYSAVKTPRPIGTKVAKQIKEEEGAREEMIAKKLKLLESIAESGRILAMSFQSESYANLAAVYESKGKKKQAKSFLMKAVALAAGINKDTSLINNKENEHDSNEATDTEDEIVV